MAQESYPFDEAPWPEDGWSRTARHWQDSGVVGDPGGSALLVSANASGMQVFVAVGEAQVRGHHYRNTASVTLAIAANAAGSTRIDRVVSRLNPSTNSIALVVVQGTAGSGVPSLSATQTDTGIYDLPLAQVTVDPGAVNIAAGKVADDRRFTGTRTIACRTTADITSPRVGQHVFESTTGAYKGWNGSTWDVLYNPSASLVPVGTVTAFAGATDPAGWLVCDGRAVGRATYPALFALVGTQHGAGDGSTFNLPNLKGRVPVGRDAAQGEFDALGEAGGAKTHTLTTAELASHGHNHGHTTSAGGLHSHTVQRGITGVNQSASDVAVVNEYDPTGFATSDSGNHAHTTDANAVAAGGGAAHNNLQPYTVLNYIIKHS